MSAKPRPETSAILGVSMSLELKRRIKTLADAEERTMAKWCAIKLKQIVEDLDAAAAHPPLASLPPAQKQPAAKSIKRA